MQVSDYRFKVIFFGANDACLEGAQGSQHVPLTRYVDNIAAMLDHPSVKAQAPRIILVTPPPINEYACEVNDRSKGILQSRRKALHTRLYADAVRELAAQRCLACLDIWTYFMKHAGWSGDNTTLPGSKDLPENVFMRMLLHDG